MSTQEIRPYEYFLMPGYIYLNREPSLLSTVVGSNVAVAIWDQKKIYGGMANFLYPQASSASAATPQYGDVAVAYLIKMFMKEGADRKNLRAQIFGGAEKESLEIKRNARENVRIARKILRTFRVEIISEDMGGHMGRKIVYNTLKNEAIVYKVSDLRSSDWFPYVTGSDRGSVR